MLYPKLLEIDYTKMIMSFIKNWVNKMLRNPNFYN